MSTESGHVLLVEDEPAIAEVLVAYLQRDGYEVTHLARGGEVLRTIAAGKFALVLLDVNLPDIDGFRLCRLIRGASSTPIIMITARSDEIDRITGLDLGADDYVCKPFSPSEVLARVRAVLRRLRPAAASTSATLVIEANTREVHFRGVRLDLTGAEFALLLALDKGGGRVRTRAQLGEAMGGAGLSSDRAVDSHIKNIRKKIAVIAPEADPIKSVYGVGYRLEV